MPFPTAAVEILRHAAGDTIATTSIYSGRRFGMAEAHDLGLVTDLVEVPEALMASAVELATNLGRLDRPAFTLAKTQLRRGALELVERHRAPDDAVLAERWTAPDTMDAIREYLRRLKAPSPR